MLNLVMKSLPFTTFTAPLTTPRTSRLQFLVNEVRTFRTMLDELKRAQQATARYEALPHWTATSSRRVHDEFYTGH